MERLIGGTTTFTGSFPYVVRLAFQTFDQFHSDSQVWSQLEYILIFHFIYLHQFQNYFKQYNLCAGTVIDQHWILTSATCCKRDDIVTITFNDYSIFYADQNQNEIISTIFHIHQDFDACLIRTTDISNIVPHIPCLTKVKFQLFLAVVRETLTLNIQTLDIKAYEGARCWNPGWGSSSINGAWATNLESIGVNLLNGGLHN